MFPLWDTSPCVWLVENLFGCARSEQLTQRMKWEIMSERIRFHFLPENPGFFDCIFSKPNEKNDFLVSFDSSEEALLNGIKYFSFHLNLVKLCLKKPI